MITGNYSYSSFWLNLIQLIFDVLESQSWWIFDSFACKLLLSLSSHKFLISRRKTQFLLRFLTLVIIIVLKVSLFLLHLYWQSHLLLLLILIFPSSSLVCYYDLICCRIFDYFHIGRLSTFFRLDYPARLYHKYLRCTIILIVIIVSSYIMADRLFPLIIIILLAAICCIVLFLLHNFVLVYFALFV